MFTELLSKNKVYVLYSTKSTFTVLSSTQSNIYSALQYQKQCLQFFTVPKVMFTVPK